MNIRKFLSNFLSSGFLEEDDTFLLHQVYLVNFCSFLVGGALFVFGLLNLMVYANVLLGWVEWSIGILIFANALLLRKSRQVDFTKHVFILLGLNILFILLLTGGIENTGILWFYVFPGAVIFLLGLRQGIIWLAILFVAIAVFLGLERLYFVELPYNFIFVRQMFFSLLLVAMIAGFAEYTRVQDSRARKIWGK